MDTANGEEDERQLRRFFDMSLELLAVAGVDGMFRRLNPAWEQTLGWSVEELLAEPFISFVHPDDVERTLDEVQGLAQGAETVSFVNRYRCKDGTYRSLRWSAAPDDTGAVFAAARDITEFQQATREALQTEDLLTAVLKTAADPILLIDSHGAIQQVNEATTRLFGYDEDALLGENVKMLMPEPYRSEHDGYLARYLHTGDARIIGIGREVTAQKSDGSTFPMHLAVSEVDTPDGKLFTGVIHDLTELHAVHEELTRANEDLEERVAERTAELAAANLELSRSNRDLEQFAYIASHDLQAPLRNVRQGIELLDAHLTETVGASFDEEATELQGLIVDAVGRMEDMIRGLLSFSRVQREREVAKPVDLQSVTDDVLRQLRLDLQAAGASVTAANLPVVTGDATLLVQLMQNLIQNAVKYRSPDRAPEIAITAVDRDGRWQISVADNGIGIDPDKHDRVFELFRRAHAGYDGVGIGLAICQRVVERHGGDIWVESTPDSGTTFTFTLPITVETEEANR